MLSRFDFNKQNTVGDWSCVVTQEPWNELVKVYLMFRGNGKHQIATIKDGQMELSDIKDGDESKPLFVMSYFAWEAVLGVIGGIPSDIKQEETNSELKATKYHLEDMRNLVFLKDYKKEGKK